MLNIIDKDHYDKIKKFAKDNSLWEGHNGLQDNLEFLAQYNEHTECQLYSDFAPFSFYFVMLKNGKRWFNGGLIYHGPHDNGGDGGAPTFSISLNPDTRPHWSVHT